MNIVHKLDEGNYGTIYLVKHGDRDQEVVCKIANLNKLNLRSPSSLLLVEKEVTALKELSKSSAKQYVPEFIDSHYGVHDDRPAHFILMEYIIGNELIAYTENWTGNIPCDMLYHLMEGLINGLCAIHENGFTHGDIKPENILVTDDGIIKYVDFGFSCNVDNVDTSHKSKRGTLMYNPPEFYTEHPYVNSFPKAKARDVWSLGIVMYELAHGINKVPYDITATLVQEEIAVAPYIVPDYRGDHGEVNSFLFDVIVNNWQSRPLMTVVKEKFHRDVLKDL